MCLWLAYSAYSHGLPLAFIGSRVSGMVHCRKLGETEKLFLSLWVNKIGNFKQPSMKTVLHHFLHLFLAAFLFIAAFSFSSCSRKTEKISVGQVFFNQEYFVMKVGESAVLTARVFPDNADDKSLIWTSSNKGVATVDQNGKVTAVSAGTEIITATTKDGSWQSASCSVVVIDEPTAVDLGLSVKWASFNLGASAADECGLYYAWGEIAPKSKYDWSTYQWSNGSYTSFIKYNTSRDFGPVVDNKTTLDPDDDVAHVVLGGSWRMPTIEDWVELFNCDWTWTTQNGMNGYKVTSTITDKWIFLPAAGSRLDTHIGDVGSYSNYWSSSLGTVDPDYARFVYFHSEGVYSTGKSRCFGYSVRPVLE